MKLQDKISCLKGVGSKRAETLKKLNIETLEDLLYFFPRRYEDRRRIQSIMEAEMNQEVLLCGKPVQQKAASESSGGRQYRQS